MDVFSFPWMNVQSVVTGLLGECMFHFASDCETVFRSGCPFPHFHRQRMRAPASLKPRWHLLLSPFSNRCAEPSHGLNFHFPDDSRWRTSFHVFICHPDVLSGEMSLHSFCPFSYRIVCDVTVLSKTSTRKSSESYE